MLEAVTVANVSDNNSYNGGTYTYGEGGRKERYTSGGAYNQIALGTYTANALDTGTVDGKFGAHCLPYLFLPKLTAMHLWVVNVYPGLSVR